MGTIKSLTTIFALGAFPYAICGTGEGENPPLIKIVQDPEKQLASTDCTSTHSAATSSPIDSTTKH